MIQYPIIFKGGAEGPSGKNTSWDVFSSSFESTCAVPPEFEGSGGTFSPEDFFLLALENCFVATFKVYAEYSKFDFDRIEISSTLTVDKDASGQVTMKDIHFSISLIGVKDARKAQLLAKKVIETGFILKSVKTDISYELTTT